MIFPKKLKKGDTVGLVCTSSPIRSEMITGCLHVIKEMGFEVKAADNLDVDYGGYMAGNGRLRAQWINRMFSDDEVKGIFCVRGGYGSSRMMDYLDYGVIRENPKIFVGYSDVTNLHLAIANFCNFVTFHGPMVYSDMISDFDDETRNSLIRTINADEELEFKNPKGFDIKVLKEGAAAGRLIGGNLSLLSASIGTSYEVDTRDNILFIEETCEPVGKIEKWAYHLKAAGKFEACRGIVLGQFSGIFNDSCAQFGALECLSDILEDIDVPVFYNIQSGHGKPMMTLPMGAYCNMDSSSKMLNFHVIR